MLNLNISKLKSIGETVLKISHSQVRWTEGQTDGNTDGQKDRWKDGLKDGQLIFLCPTRNSFAEENTQTSFAEDNKCTYVILLV